MCVDMMVKQIVLRSDFCRQYFPATVLLVLFLVIGSMTPASAKTGEVKKIPEILDASIKNNKAVKEFTALVTPITH